MAADAGRISAQLARVNADAHREGERWMRNLSANGRAGAG
jgi:hypothetical protein